MQIHGAVDTEYLFSIFVRTFKSFSNSILFVLIVSRSILSRVKGWDP